jgi:amino acid adenylation domain-containing protein
MSHVETASTTLEKRRLLAMLMKEASLTPSGRLPLVPRLSRGPATASYAQQRLWMLEQLEGGSHYIEVFQLRLSGELDVPSLERAYNAILQRHEAMRTRFLAEGGAVLQEVVPFREAPLPLRDLAAMTPGGRETEMQRIIQAEGARRFDLRQSPLWRATLLRLEPRLHCLVLAAHHIATDGWSQDVFIRDMAILYQSFLSGQPAPLPPLNLQYTDYAAAEQQFQNKEKEARQLAYWKEKLKGAPPVLELPTDRPRPRIRSFRGERHVFQIDLDLCARLKTFSKAEGCTLFMTLLAAFQTLLHRHTRQDDILVGTPSANRASVELEKLIGCFVNTWVMRENLSGNLSFRALLHRVRETALEAYSNPDLPFERLVEDMHPARSISHSPIFQVMFVMQNTPMPTVRLPKLLIESAESGNHSAKFDLTLTMTENERGVEGCFEYATDLFDASTIERMSGHFRELLNGAVAKPGLPIADLPLLPPAERKLLLETWNATDAPCNQSDSVQRLFQAQAAKTPHAIAVKCGAEQLSYEALSQRANQLAHYLHSQGVQPNTLVAIALPRSTDMLVAILGVLNAGAGYLPLDPEYPAERLSTMLQDARPDALLTRSHVAKKIQSQAARVVLLEDIQAVLHTLPASAPPPVKSGPHDLAYVIYTSGSAGRPKGVAISHLNLLNSTLARLAYYADPVERFLLLSSFSFDSSVAGIFWTLLQGGALHIAELDAQQDPHILAKQVASERITHLLCVPGLYAMLLSAGKPAQLASLKTVIVAGEACPRELVATNEKILPRAKLFNEYGPTETCVWCAVHECKAGQCKTCVPIGRPIQNTRLYVLDARHNPVPVGVPGELHIGGAGVAPGYLGNPQLTTEKFIADPFGTKGPFASRLYRTGDLCRYLPDGSLVFLGREDTQVKIRGYRIELEEIESVLRQHPAVKETVLAAREDTSGNMQLVAYVVSKDTMQAEALRNWLRDKLPGHMIPAIFEPLDTLPLTPTGKVDRKALPAPENFPASNDGKQAKPRTALEQILTDLWSEILGVPILNIHASFFDMGGYSLLAMQTVLRVKDELALDQELPVRSLFESPTIAQFAASIVKRCLRDDSRLRPSVRKILEDSTPDKAALHEHASSPSASGSAMNGKNSPAEKAKRELLALMLQEEGFENSDSATRSLSNSNGRSDTPASFAQRRLWLTHQLDPDSPVYNESFGFNMHGPLDIHALRQSLNDIVRRHEILRTEFAVKNDQPMQIVQPLLELDLPVFDLRDTLEALRHEMASQIAADTAQKIFDLSRAPLIRAALIRLKEDEHQLVIVVHHIIFDGWSVGLFCRELSDCYKARVAGRQPSLPPLAAQYGDYSVWQHAWLTKDVLNSQLTYWREKLSGKLPVLALPTDRPRPLAQTFNGDVVRAMIGGETPAKLNALGRSHGASLFMVLLTAYNMLLARLSSQTDIIVGTHLAGRTREHLNEIIGFFVSTLALRADLSGDPSFVEALQRVRETALDAFAHQELPFEKLVEELNPPRDRSRHPIFQTGFSLQKDPLAATQFEGLDVAALEIEHHVSKFDISCFATENADRLELAFEYNTDLFDASTVQRIVAQYITLLDAVLSNAELKLSQHMLPETATHPAIVQPKERSAPAGNITLPKPQPVKSSELSTPNPAARISTQTAVSKIFRDVLELRTAGIQDSFFDLGGHSLLATQVVSRVRDLFKINLPLRAIFDAPTIADLSAVIDQELLKIQQPKEDAILTAGREGSQPLSFSQQRLWFLNELEPDSAAYNIPIVLRCKGHLDVPALQRAISDIAQRHGILRARFHSVEGQPAQVIAPLSGIDLAVVAVPDGSEQERLKAARRMAAQEAFTLFDLNRGPLLRARLLRMSHTDHVLIVTMHHIASDGWSLGILFRELAALYEARKNNESDPLPELTLQYTDFARWQRQRLAGEHLTAQLAYWKEKLNGLQPLELHTDRPRPVIRTHNGALHDLVFSRETTDAIQRLCHQERVTEFMLLLAVFNTLLARHTGQEDIAVGTPVAGRNRVEIEPLIGFFVNTLVMRGDLSGDPTFHELLERMRNLSLSAFAHQDIPFEKLVEDLQPQRSRSQTPLFQVMFALQNALLGDIKLAGLELTPIPLEQTTAKFDLMLTLWETPGGLRGQFEYNTDLFDAATIVRMDQHYQMLLQSALKNPQQRVSELAMLTDAEWKHVLVELNNTKTPYPRQGLARLFETQARRSPDAVAVSYGNRQITYRELNERANKLAHFLRAGGAKPGQPIAVCADRSIELIEGILAIIKAGGGYVPLDPSYPRERLAFMLKDTQCPILISQEKHSGIFPPSECRTILIDRDWPEIERQPATNPTGSTGGDDLAYIIFTSGSTGTPKGIRVPQKGVVRLVCNTSYITLDAKDIVAQISNASFDAATFEIWGALLHGGRLTGITSDIALSPNEFAAEIRRQHISALFMTTALFNLLATENPAVFRSVRYVLFGGEACDARAVRAVLKGGPPRNLLHVYGPTEVTTFSTCHKIESVAEHTTTVTIGRPISNTEAYILDRHKNPLPIGVPGELYLGGDGLALGYHNREDLTNAKFVPHPFSTTPGAKLYRSGDLAKFLPGGDIEFIGRLDHQVKIRGFRIELGEIESVLATHPSVRELAVVAREDTPGARRIVAYLSAHDASRVSGEQLRAYLRERLPDYMIPSAFILLPTLPLTHNGKVDRHALPVPEGLLAKTQRTVTPPRIPLHSQIIHIWEGLLNVHPIGITENFFELGGHSLLAVRMMDLIEQICGRKLPLSALFAAATVEQLADALLKQNDTTPEPAMTRLNADGRKPPLFFLHGDLLGGGLYCRSLARHLGPDQPLFVLAAKKVPPDRLPPSVETIAADLLREIQAIKPKGPCLLGGYCFGGCVAYEMARQLRAKGEIVGLLVLVDSTPPDRIQNMARTITSTLSLGGVFRRKTRARSTILWIDRLTRLSAFNQLPLGEKIKIAWRKALGIFSRHTPTASPPACDSLPQTAGDGVAAETRKWLDAYGWVQSGYKPKPCPGPLLLLVSQELVASYHSASWADLVQETTVQMLPGDHLSCITRHVSVLAEHIAAELDKLAESPSQKNNPARSGVLK